ncbi:MAG: type II toxin-antitoxin system HicA family toxin [Anaerolineae bacterium]
MPRRPRVTGRKVAKVLEKAGFILSRTRGSHRIYRHPESGRRVTVPVHRGRIIPPGTLANILRQAGLDWEDFESLL